MLCRPCFPSKLYKLVVEGYVYQMIVHIYHVPSILNLTNYTMTVKARNLNAICLIGDAYK